MEKSGSQNSNGNGSFPNDALAAFNLQKTYGRRRVVDDVSLSVEQGEVVRFLGRMARVERRLFMVFPVLPDKILIWLITKDGLNIAKTELSSDVLQDKAAEYIELISKNTESGEQLHLSKELYRILIAPIKRQTRLS